MVKAIRIKRRRRRTVRASEVTEIVSRIGLARTPGKIGTGIQNNL